MHMWASDTVGGVPLHVYAYGQQPTMVHCRRKLVRHTDRGRGQRPTRARDISAVLKQAGSMALVAGKHRSPNIPNKIRAPTQ